MSSFFSSCNLFKKKQIIDISNIVFYNSGTYNNVYTCLINDKIYILRLTKLSHSQLLLDNEKKYTLLMNKLNVCPYIHDIYIDNNKLFILMDYYNHNLLHFINNYQFNNIYIKNTIIKNIINIISKISKKKIILLDLKPSNIVINNNFIIRFIDFDPNFIINHVIINHYNIHKLYKIIMLIILANHLYLLNNNIFCNYLLLHINDSNYKYINIILKYLLYKKKIIFYNYFLNNINHNNFFDNFFDNFIHLLINRSQSFF